MTRLVLFGAAAVFVVFLILVESQTCFPEGVEAYAARLDLKEVGRGLDLYHARFGRYPARGAGVPALYGEGLLLGVPRTDPWGHSYELVHAHTDGVRPDVSCLGVDGLRGTEDDIYLSEPRPTCFFGICL